MIIKNTKWLIQDKVSKRYFSFRPENWNGGGWSGGPAESWEVNIEKATDFSKMFENIAEGCLVGFPENAHKIPDSCNIKHVPEPKWVKVEITTTYTVVGE